MRDVARDIRRALTDSRRLCEQLGLTERAKRQARGVIICCPVHGEKNPSCSVTTGPDGTIRVRCFACDFSGDALTLVAVARGLDVRDAFAEVLAEAAELAGLRSLADDLRRGKARPEYEPVAPPEPRPEPPYPGADEVLALWEASGPCADDRLVSGVLVGRKIDPVEVDARKLGRVIRAGQTLPDWARYGNRTWLLTGHRLLLRVFDAAGELRSVRAWRVSAGSSPKRLPPAGRKHAGLVLANRRAVAMLRGMWRPRELFVVEGEPDFLVCATRRDPGDAVIGVGSGSWTEDFAARVPHGCDVYLWTHDDPAGERYADAIARTLSDRAVCWRASA